MANGTPLDALSATINQLVLFNQVVNLNPPIKFYEGEPLYITGFTTAGNTLTIAISNDGPPVANLVPPQAAAYVKAVITYKGPPASTSDPTANMVNFSNQSLVLTAAVVPQSTSTNKWNDSTLLPTVAEWSGRKNWGVVYVIRHDGGNGQLWWLVTPDDTTPTATSATFIDEPKGGAVHGPFGIQTP